MSVRNTVKSIQDIMRQDSGVDGDAQRISQLCWMFFLKIIDDQDQQLELMQDGYRSPIPKQFRWRSWAADPEGITGEELLTFVNTELFPKLKELSVVGEKADRRRVVRDVFENAYNYMKSGQLMRQVINKINEVNFNNLAEKQHFGDIYEQILNDLQSVAHGRRITPRQRQLPGCPLSFLTGTTAARAQGREGHGAISGLPRISHADERRGLGRSGCGPLRAKTTRTRAPLPAAQSCHNGNASCCCKVAQNTVQSKGVYGLSKQVSGEWRQMAWETGAVRRLRGFSSPDTLLRTLMLHVARGYSLRETVVRAKLAKWADISDVALLKRLRNGEEWLRSLCIELFRQNAVARLEDATLAPSRIVDSTIVREPGKTGVNGGFCTV